MNDGWRHKNWKHDEHILEPFKVEVTGYYTHLFGKVIDVVEFNPTGNLRSLHPNYLQVIGTDHNEQYLKDNEGWRQGEYVLRREYCKVLTDNEDYLQQLSEEEKFD